MPSSGSSPRSRFLPALLAATALVGSVVAQDQTLTSAGGDVPAGSRSGGGGGGGGGGQSSLDMDTCGCPTSFDSPQCVLRTNWSVDNNGTIGTLFDPQNTPYEFEVWVFEESSAELIKGGGRIHLTNSGDLSAVLSSVSVLLEETAAKKSGDAPGPGGRNWKVLSTAIANESQDCEDQGIARTCYGDLLQSPGARLVLLDPNTNDVIALENLLPIPPTIDNDGDGLRDEDPALPTDPSLLTGGCAIIDNDGDGLYDEDPINGIDDDMDGLIDEDDPDDDGDGLVDEDGACEDAVVIDFLYEFDIAGLGITPGDGVVPSADDLRIDVLATFGSAGGRGGSGATCTLDVNCNGVIDADDPGTPTVNESEQDNIRTIQQRHRFDPPVCVEECSPVTLTSNGAESEDPTCASVTTNTLNEVIHPTGVPGTMWKYKIQGTVSCVGSDCETQVTSVATLSGPGCDEGHIRGNPNGATFAVVCSPSTGNQIAPGDFCTQLQTQFGSGGGLNFLTPIWNALYPGGMNVGDLDGIDSDTLYAIHLTSAQAVVDYLPALGPPGFLTADLIDPLATSSGTFGGQLVAAELNVHLDDLGIRTMGGVPAHPPGTLRTLVYQGCVEPALVGLTVQEVLDIAHTAISGGGLPPGLLGGSIVLAVRILNEEFQDCDTYRGCLGFP